MDYFLYYKAHFTRLKKKPSAVTVDIVFNI